MLAAVLEAFRLFHCRECGRAVCICRQCDRGQVYCTRGCAAVGRCVSMRAAGRRYQSSRRGAARHAARQREYRLRCAQAGRSPGQNKVTHQPSSPAVAVGTVPRNAAATAWESANDRQATEEGAYAGEPVLRCDVILGLTSGCRNHELASIEEGAIRQTTHGGEVFYWLKGVSIKTHCGRTEWMIPEIGAKCVQILERWAAPLRVELCDTLASIQHKLASTPREITAFAALLNQHRRLEADRRRLFLGKGNGRVGSVSGSHWKVLMREYAKHAGVDWPLATHQLRRTFAANVANHILGDLIYLKHHYKHWSLDMTALYALNAQQEQGLFDEVLHAVREKKIRIIEHWLDTECMIVGGAAGPIKAFRAKHRLATVATRKKLAEDTSEMVNIRATGHGWCLASDGGCGGQGLYEPTRCLDCRNGVIDSSHVPVWENILAQQRELLVSAADCGPSGTRRIERDLAHAEKVLGDLGVTIGGPTNER